MGKLLISEPPLQVLPSLAVRLGLNEAIIIQQIHYWTNSNEQTNTNFHEGFHWVYNSYEKWANQFPFWSASTIKRAINNLEKMEILVSDNFNKIKMDKTKWYRINYGKLLQFDEPVTRRSGQNDPTSGSNCTELEVKMTKAIPKITTKITTKKSSSSSDQTNLIPFFIQNVQRKGFDVSPLVAELIGQLEDEFGNELVLEAMKITAEQNKDHIRYVEGILMSWKEQNVKTVEEARLLTEQFKEKRKSLNKPKVAVGTHDKQNELKKEYECKVSEYTQTKNKSNDDLLIFLEE